ncbi:hypothetical protein D9611_010513 [Ephemerocybe angulata]|uniref:Uncharacterized protein n=1 Tax=Ephemerocybe angulata TaxID=980116 RepID=A0A8H5FAQ6_9AGAR|nr:hypothetical protein D9611_010513 [Tulosesus angulatus]
MPMSFHPLPSSPTLSTNNGPRAPPEIIDAVLDELASDKKDIESFHTLLRCSLVSQHLSWRCRMHIFQEINLGWSKDALRSQDSQGLTSGTVSGLVDLLFDNPSLSEQILSLRINPAFYYYNPGRGDLCDNLSTLLEQLPNLRTFALTSGSDPDAASLPWSWFPVVAQSAIEACCARPTIKCVEFRGFKGFPTNLIYTCSSSLTTLYLSRTMSLSTGDPMEQNQVEHAANGGPLRRPPWSLESLVCENALPLLRPAIDDESNPHDSPFSSLQHLNVAILTYSDSRLIAPLLRQSEGSMRTLEVSFSLWTGASTFETNWIHLPHLRRLHVAVSCTQVQNDLHFPNDVPNLIYDVVYGQTSIKYLSIHTTCQMVYVPPPPAGHQSVLNGDEGWRRLGDRLASEAFTNLSMFRVSLSVFLVQQDGASEITRGACEEVEEWLTRDVITRFERPGRSLSTAICVQSLRELFHAA